ncbi:MAG TPA: hypothetical protein VFC44_06285 [Candidatus Saccharimonadales bacterium]|nr:hypothetical protein [Candidatus Saccharimonadales bacterium]
MLALLSPRFFRGAIPILFCLMLSGCSTSTPPLPKPNSEVVQIPASWTPHLLYLLPSPHPRLYVEVDAVEGSAPGETELHKLRGFLSAYCNKPDGIEIVRGPVIPIEAARGMTEKALARKYMRGPDTNTASPSAFMYVLFYNDALCKDSAAGQAPARRREITHPYTEILFYPAIYINTRYQSGWGRNEDILHEAGHILGLVRRPAGVYHHCPNPACLMNVDLRLRRWLVGQQRRLCPDCVAELKQQATQPPPVNLRYVGPVLVRSETGYHVLSLPGRVRLLAGDQTGGTIEKSCQAFAARVRAEQDDGGESVQVDCVAPDELLGDTVKVSQTIDRFKNDPFEFLRDVAPKSLLRACGDRYYALGQYSNVVATLQQVILFDAKDDWSYNQLAWMEAMCPDASVRDGQAAVTAASRACELTEWKNGQFIDTLAAACAEAGDFKHAIQFEKQALRTGRLTDSEQKEMQERLSIYQELRPFREKPDKP